MYHLGKLPKGRLDVNNNFMKDLGQNEPGFESKLEMDPSRKGNGSFSLDFDCEVDNAAHIEYYNNPNQNNPNN